MTEHQRSVAEEVVTDNADGIITRREAVRGLGCSASPEARRRRCSRPTRRRRE